MNRRPRPGSEAPGIRGLSLGTANQLDVAPRLASLETALDARGPVPLIADVVLIQFDDRRTAAPRVLARIAGRTRVIVFTHDNHVCQLAQSCVEGDKLFIQE